MMTLFGVLWAMFAPLSLVAMILALRLALRRVGAPRPAALAAALALVPVCAIYAWDRMNFSRVCQDIGAARIDRRANADGIYLNSPTANSFGTRYLSDEGFLWLERQDIYDRKGFVRVTRDAAGVVHEEKIPAPTALYEVAETDERREGINVSVVRVIERATGAEMARAGDAYFLGGTMAIFLGAWGATSCQSAFSDPERFRGYYHLARNTLRPPAEAGPAR